jgi:dipeptidyl aminopeptidase/acylaminoacyl peptidase
VRPSDPTPTPLPLATPNVKASGKIWFIVESKFANGQMQRALHYLSIGIDGRPEQAAPARVDMPNWPDLRVPPTQLDVMPHLQVAPSGKYAAITYGWNGLTIVNMQEHQVVPFELNLERELLVRLGQLEFGGWHPDSRHFALFSRSATGIWLLDVEGKDSSRQLSEHTADSVAFSPDGQKLAFSERPPLNPQSILWLGAADGSNLQKIVERPREQPIDGLSWSPDRKKLAFLMGGGNIWIVDADGKNARQITTGYASGWGFPPPLWSPDGRFLLYPSQERSIDKAPDAYLESGAYRHVNIRLFNLETNQSSKLIPDSEVGNLHPVWSPNGSQIAFMSNRGGEPALWIIGLDGKNLRQLPTNNARISMPIWSP